MIDGIEKRLILIDEFLQKRFQSAPTNKKNTIRILTASTVSPSIILRLCFPCVIVRFSAKKKSELKITTTFFRSKPTSLSNIGDPIVPGPKSGRCAHSVGWIFTLTLFGWQSILQRCSWRSLLSTLPLEQNAWKMGRCYSETHLSGLSRSPKLNSCSPNERMYHKVGPWRGKSLEIHFVFLRKKRIKNTFHNTVRKQTLYKQWRRHFLFKFSSCFPVSSARTFASQQAGAFCTCWRCTVGLNEVWLRFSNC